MIRIRVTGTYCSLTDRLWPILLRKVSCDLSKKKRSMRTACILPISPFALGTSLLGKQGFCVLNHRARGVLAITRRAEVMAFLTLDR